MDNRTESQAELGQSERKQEPKSQNKWLTRWIYSTPIENNNVPIMPPPDGGLMAWTQVAMGHLVICNTFGFANSFGVFQSYYPTALDRPPSDISWIGSMQLFLLFAVGAISGRALDGGLFHLVFTIGWLLHVLGIFMTSISSTYWQVLLAQGVCVGVGNGLLFCPAISLISTYFSKKRSLAMGMAAAGGATGGLVYPVMVQRLLPQIGFGWTVRALGLIAFLTGGLAVMLMRPRLPPRKSGPLIEWAAFREPPYVLYCVGMFLVFWALYYAAYYIGAYARDIIGLTYTESVDMIMIMNSIGYIGRILPNIIADRYTGPLNAIIPCTLGSGILLFAWAGVHNNPGQIGFAVFYGLFSSGVQSMFAVALSSLTKDLSKAGTRMGMCFSIVSLSTLTGPPIAGALITANGGNYLLSQMWGGTVVVAGTMAIWGARVCAASWKLRERV